MRKGVVWAGAVGLPMSAMLLVSTFGGVSADPQQIAQGSNIFATVNARNNATAMTAYAAIAQARPTFNQQAQGNRCSPGQGPSYTTGFANLKAQVGDAMGQPVTCEFPDPNGTGDVHQRTTTGLAFWRKSTNTPTFTDGYNHWALTSAGAVTWTGSAIDPPAAATVAGPDFSAFAGSRTNRDSNLDVRADGSASMTYRAGGAGVPIGQMTLQFNTATGRMATGRVATSNDPTYGGATVLLTLLGSDAVALRVGSRDFGNLCGPGSPPGICTL